MSVLANILFLYYRTLWQNQDISCQQKLCRKVLAQGHFEGWGTWDLNVQVKKSYIYNLHHFWWCCSLSFFILPCMTFFHYFYNINILCISSSLLVHWVWCRDEPVVGTLAYQCKPETMPLHTIILTDGFSSPGGMQPSGSTAIGASQNGVHACFLSSFSGTVAKYFRLLSVLFSCQSRPIFN